MKKSTMFFKKSNRRVIREKVLQILYAYEYNQGNLEELISGITLELTSEIDRKFADSLVRKVIIHKDKYDKEITLKVDNWELNRIAIIDRILIRMGLCELEAFPDIPPKVTINEVIEIAKEFSTASSGKFVNGILDSFLSDLKESGKLNKVGRGLLDNSIQKLTEDDD